MLMWKCLRLSQVDGRVVTDGSARLALVKTAIEKIVHHVQIIPAPEPAIAMSAFRQNNKSTDVPDCFSF